MLCVPCNTHYNRKLISVNVILVFIIIFFFLHDHYTQTSVIAGGLSMPHHRRRSMNNKLSFGKITIGIVIFQYALEGHARSNSVIYGNFNP